MEYTEEEKALVWLCGCTELDLRERVNLLRAAGGSPVELFRRFEEFAEEKSSLSERETALGRFLGEMEEKGRFAVTSVSEDYPELLRHASPPLVLFGAGDRSLLGEELFCIVGSRITPPWAAKLGGRIAEELSERFVIVTGLAEGGDLAALRGAEKSGRRICVLPCGLDECYPAAHSNLKAEIERKGLVLTECAPREQTRKYSFSARNRILAGLARGTLVISAGEKSGALITAGYAVDFGRDLFAFPYNPGIAQGVGCNRLLKEGAYVTTSEEDVFERYGIVREKAARPDLSEEERAVYDVLREEGELHAAVVAERVGRPVYEVASLLSALELKGLVVKAGGNRYGAV